MGFFDFLKSDSPKKSKIETFSGEGEYLHVNTNPEGFNIQETRPVKGYGESVFGDALYMSDKNDRKWFSPEGYASHMTAESGPVQSIHKVTADFNNALVVTPQNIQDLADEVTKQGVPFNEFARNYDGMIIRGFDDLSEGTVDKLFSALPDDMEMLQQDQVVNFNPADNIKKSSEVNPRDYNKAMMTAAEEKAYDRRVKAASPKELMYIDPDTQMRYFPEDLDDMPEAEKAKLKPTMEATKTSNSRGVKPNMFRANMRTASDALRKVDAKMVGKTLGFAGIPLMFLNAQDTYAKGIEEGDSKVKAGARAGVEFAWDALAPYMPEAGAGSDVVPADRKYYGQEEIVDLNRTGFERSIK